MKTAILLPLFLLPSFFWGYAQAEQPKLHIAFNKNIEFLGFGYFLGYESVISELVIMEVDGEKITRGDFHRFGYAFSKEYSHHLASEHLYKMASVAPHLGLINYVNLVLQLDDFPNAELTDDINVNTFIGFSKNRDSVEARQNIETFITEMNAFYREVDFDNFLKQKQPFYEKALEEVKTHLPKGDFIGQMEGYFNKAYDAYHLIPSLTLPKTIGFGPRMNNVAFNIFGAVTHQDPDELEMGFANTRKLREITVHELGHSFVNPCVARLPDSLIYLTASLYEPIKERMIAQDYINWSGSVYEHFVRASELVLAERFESKSDYQIMEKEYLEERQFIYIPALKKILKDYDKRGITFDEAVLEGMLKLKEINDQKSQ